MISRPLLFFDLLFLSSVALLPDILTATYQLTNMQRIFMLDQNHYPTPVAPKRRTRHTHRIFQSTQGLYQR